MRSFYRVAAALVVVALIAGIGVTAYNAGVTAGLDEAARLAAASGDPVPVSPYGYGPYAHGPWGFGFGPFVIIFWILGILLVIGLVRAAFGWERWDGRGPGRGFRGAGRHEMVEEWHRELHRRDGDPAGGVESNRAGA